MKVSAWLRPVVCIAVALVLAGGTVSTTAFAADKKDKKEEKNEYPNATRKEPKLEMSAGTQKDVNKALDLLNAGQGDEAKPIVDKVKDDPKASKYAHALALQAEGQIAYDKQDYAGAIQWFRQAYDADALPNNQHFSLLYTIAQLQIQEEKYQDALNTLDEFQKASGGSPKPDPYALQANAYYRLEKFQQAVDAMKKALSMTTDVKDSWLQILMASYAELEQYDEAAKVIEQQLAKAPNDMHLIRQAATVYIKGKQDQRAIDLLASAKQKGLVKSEEDYKLIAQLYDQADKPKEAAAALNEGFTSGAVKPSYDMYKLLGDSYALAQDDAKAIDAYAKASPFAKDGNVDYVRGSLLLNNDRAKEAVDALNQAVTKGSLKQPGEAYIILGDAYNNLDNAASARAAWQKAKGYPSTQKMAEQRLSAGKVHTAPVKTKKQ
ncbi:MAG TPA: tetratricopeptide repeat protein [Rudaea sp.]